MSEEKGLIPFEEKPKDVVSRAVEQSKALMNIVEQCKLYETIESKKYLLVEGWQTIGAFNQVGALTDWVCEIVRDDVVVGYEAKVDLVKDDQIISSAIMSCGLDEFPCKGKEGEAKHKAAKSAAQTWAESKAYRMKYGFVAKLAGYEPTPAEEMIASQPSGSSSKEHWCEEHQVHFFKRGKMKHWAHPIGDTGLWHNEGKDSPVMPETIGAEASEQSLNLPSDEKPVKGRKITDEEIGEFEDALKEKGYNFSDFCDLVGENSVSIWLQSSPDNTMEKAINLVKGMPQKDTLGV